MSDPIWDGQDEEIQRLQDLLAPYRYEGPAPALPERGPEVPEVREPSSRAPLWLAAAALLTVGLTATLLAEDEGWAMTQLAGSSVCAESETCELEPGEWLVTDAESRALLEVADIGSMEVAPGSRLRLLKTGAEQHRLELSEGRIDASVVAPPRLLVVDTPAATAVDLGCAYTLEVDERGDGSLTVSSGWVSLETGSTRTLVVAGSSAAMTVERGPGLPTWWDAEDAFVSAVQAWDQGRVSDPTQMLEHARARDTYTLWHALQRVEPSQRRAVLDTISSLAPQAELDGQALIVLDEEALDAAWTELHPHWG
jgi:hypothetical protein